MVVFFHRSFSNDKIENTADRLQSFFTWIELNAARLAIDY